MNFDESLAVGKVGESLISKWLRYRGHSVMPVYEIEKSHGKGPQFYAPDQEYVAPDMLLFTGNGMLWCEAKHKTVFTWHRISKKWVTGIDIHHWGHYLYVAQLTKLPVWLLFFHRDAIPSGEDQRHGCPARCPTGLFGGDLLSIKHNHKAEPKRLTPDGPTGHGRTGMIYWAHDDLKHLASADGVYAIARDYDAGLRHQPKTESPATADDWVKQYDAEERRQERDAGGSAASSGRQ